MLDNFMTLRYIVSYLRLDFKDISRLIVSNNLAVTSEDLVIRSIYEWAKYGETTKNDNDIDNKEFSINKAVTEVIARSSEINEAGKDINNINVSAGNENEHEEGTDESKSNEFLNSSVALASISSVNQTDDGAPSPARKQKVNPRIVYLLPLLPATSCSLNLVWPICTEIKLIQHNIQSAKVFFKCLALNTSIYVNGYLPPAAIHRDRRQLRM
ncbi:kelch repeat and BTB domain-containing protein 3 [Biomphalaria glabrata]|nr:kelch repeat and BTB domain-containing protein 3 [Biomphalaria glabrata]